MQSSKFIIVLFLLLGCAFHGLSQSASCPPNIGFENGNFVNWQAATGNVRDIGFDNVITVSGSSAVNNRHTLYDRTSNPGVDQYGQFPRVSPDGGKYSVRLGNNGIGAQAERLSYTLKVPSNQPDFTLTYYYAVVFEDPDHSPHQQPRFTARVFDVAANQYIPCASFEYIATSNLPGFKKANSGTDVYYKDWSPVTINLSEYSGKEIRLEFTSADCTESGHFGYAYVDVSEECLGAITGNFYCGNPSTITLKGPSGFQTYNWYDANLKTLLGSGQSLNLSPVPPSSTRYALEVIPYPGFGCLDTVYTTIQQQAITLNVNNPPAVCAGSTVDLTAAAVKSGSQTGLTYSYWKDSDGIVSLTNPDKISASGQYYIRALSPFGCSEIKPVVVVINSLPDFTVTPPASACAPALVDITDPKYVSSQSALTYTYWSNAAATIPLTNPKAISASGTYYIKGTTATCSTIKPISVTINPVVNLVVVNPPGVCMGTTVNLTASAITRGSSSGLTYTYWKDALATFSLDNPDNVEISGQYYIKAINSTGCYSIKAVTVVVNPLPEFTVTAPAPVCAPETVDITDSRFISSQSALTYTYWTNAAATIQLANPKSVSSSGIYYIKAASATCFTIKPISVTINALVNLFVSNPPPVCMGTTVDLTASAITAGSSTGSTYTYWKDANATAALDNPDKVEQSGQYYIKALSPTGCYSIKAVVVVINPLPEFTVTSPAAVCAPETVDITDPRLITSPFAPIFTYWMDAAATIPLSNPTTVSASGIYYIKGSSSSCFIIKPITVTVNPVVNLVTVNPPGVCMGSTIDLTTSSVTTGSTAGLVLSYWRDPNASMKLENPERISSSGQYYIKAISSTGCSSIQPVVVIVYPLPEFTVISPPAVCSPLTVDITEASLISGDPGLTFSYWVDAAATIRVTNPKSISVSGTYYIKGLSITNCVSIRQVTVTVHKSPMFSLKTPQPVYAPTTVDITTLANTLDKNLTYRYSYTQDGTSPVDEPDKIELSGTYYVIGINENGCELAQPVTTKIVPKPSVFVPTAFTPFQQNNKTLFPFLVGVKTLLHFKIYNKWGNLVFQTSRADEGWDGLYKSELHFLETYTWYLDGLDELDNYFKTTGKSVLIK